MKTWRVCIAGACAAALALVAAVQATGQTLQLEDLTAPAATFTTTYSCNTAGTSTVSWTASGVANGPYPGTFTASGSLTIGPQTLPGAHPPGPNTEGTLAGPLESFEETFTIQSGTTTVTGTKTLLPNAAPPGTQGTCQQVSQFPVLDFFDGQGTVVEVSAHTRYDAQIQAVTGTTTDSGIAFVSLSDTSITGSCPAGPECQARLAGFNQTFSISDQNATCDDDDDDPGEQRDDDEDGDDECDDEDDD